MNFRQKQQAEIPETDLIPMLNVMLGLMAYFIIMTMTLSSQASFDLALPAEVKDSEVDNINLENLPNEGPLMIELNAEGKFQVDAAKLDEETLISQLKQFLARNPKDPVFLKSDEKQSYEKVLKTLAMMRQIGGDRVSLVIDEIE